MKWIGINTGKIDAKAKCRYIIRPELYRLIDGYDARNYEALACVLCQLLGANNIYLTPAGNGGIVLNFQQRCIFYLVIKALYVLSDSAKNMQQKTRLGI